MEPIETWWAFVRVAELGHFQEAARELQRSLSALRKDIARCERECGAPLLERQNKQLQLTPAGQLFYNRAKQLFALRDQTLQALNALPSESTTPPPLDVLRHHIDDIDRELIQILAKRMQIVSQMAEYKKQHGMDAYQPERWQEVLRTRLQDAEDAGLDRHFVERIMSEIHQHALALQAEQLGPKSE